jgi:hypothetical protein
VLGEHKQRARIQVLGVSIFGFVARGVRTMTDAIRGHAPGLGGSDGVDAYGDRWAAEAGSGHVTSALSSLVCDFSSLVPRPS